MSQILTLELDDEVYAAIERHARKQGRSAADWLASALRKGGGLLPTTGLSGGAGKTEVLQNARKRFERNFGAVDLGRPTGAQNEAIDADLARAYVDSHESP